MIKPCGHRVLIEADDITQVDPAYKKLKELGLHVAEHEDKLRKEAGLDRGKVVAIGPDAWKAYHYNANPPSVVDVPFVPWCKIGDVVVFAKYAGKMVEDYETKKKYIVVNDEDIAAIIQEA